MNKWFDLIEKLALVTITLGIVAYLLLATKFWAADLQFYFFKAGDFGNFIIIGATIFVLSWILKKFLLWEIHSALGPKKRRRKK